METPEELTRIAETGGMAELRRWAKSHIDELRAQPAALESTYLALKQKSAGAAFLFAYVLPKELTPKVAASDIATARANNPGLWVVGVAHIRSGPVHDRARHALDSGDVLFGLQRHYCAGSGPTPVIFTSVLDFEEHLRSTRPGDEFMLLSVRELSQQGVLLQPNVPAVRKYLAANPSEEVFLLTITPPPGHIEVLWKERDDEEDIEPLFQKEGIIAVPFVWEQEFYIDAKMSNDLGATPLGGAY